MPPSDAEAQSRPLEIKALSAVWEKAKAWVLQPDGKERSAYFLGYRSGNTVYLAELVIPPADAFLEHNTGFLKVSNEWLSQNIFKEAVYREFDVVADVHSHPFGNGGVAFSGIDDASDHIVLTHIQDRLPLARAEIGRPKIEMTGIALVIDRGSVDARGYDHTSKRFLPVSRIALYGDKNFEILYPTSAKKQSQSAAVFNERYSRQIEIFGLPGQLKMADVRVAICGAGGLGSILIEGVLRLGIKDVAIIDDDLLDASNLHRWQGGAPGDVGKPKVELLKTMHERNFPDASITAIHKSIYDPEAVAAIAKADIVLGGVDNGVARAFLSRLCAQYMVAYIDGAAQVVKREASEAAPIYRIMFMVPGITACLDCASAPVYEAKEIRSAFLNPLALRMMREGGYLSDEPALAGATVYGLNLACTGAMRLELQNYLVGDRRPRHRFSNAEFLQGLGIPKEGIESILEHKSISDSIDFGHGLALPYDDCPYCQGRRAGRMGTLRLMYPATVEKEAKLPDPARFMKHDEEINGDTSPSST